MGTRNMANRSLVIWLAASWIVFVLVWAFVFFTEYGLNLFTSISLFLAGTPLLGEAGRHMYAAGIGATPAPTLIATAPLFPLLGFVAWSLRTTYGPNGRKAAEPRVKASAGFLVDFQFTLVLIAVLGHLILGLPLATALFGDAVLHAAWPCLAFSSVIIVICALSAAFGAGRSSPS